jgi:hypothetical protein
MGVTTWHERPGFLGRLLTRLLRERFGLPPEVTCEVLDVRSNRKPDLPVYLVKILSGKETLMEWWLPRQWLAEVYREDLAFHEGRLVLQKYLPRHQNGPHADWMLVRCWPFQAPDGTLKIAVDRVGVARQTDGTFLVVRGPYGDRPPPPGPAPLPQTPPAGTGT